MRAYEVNENVYMSRGGALGCVCLDMHMHNCTVRIFIGAGASHVPNHTRDSMHVVPSLLLQAAASAELRMPAPQGVLSSRGGSGEGAGPEGQCLLSHRSGRLQLQGS